MMTPPTGGRSILPLHPPLRVGEPVEMEFRLIGSELTLKVNGFAPLQAPDEALKAGGFGIWAQSRQQAPLKVFQYLIFGEARGVAPAAPAP